MKIISCLEKTLLVLAITGAITTSVMINGNALSKYIQSVGYGTVGLAVACLVARGFSNRTDEDYLKLK